MSTPVSMTATRTPLPVDCFHNSSIRTRCNDQGRPAYFAEGKVHWVESSAAAGSTGSVTKRTAVAAAAVSGRLRGDGCVVTWPLLTNPAADGRHPSTDGDPSGGRRTR